MTSFKFPGHDGEIEFETLPQASRVALLSRVVGHFNNEYSAAMIAFGRQAVARLRSQDNGKEIPASSVTTEESREYRESHPDELQAFGTKWFATKLGEILDGTLGHRTSGSGAVVDPVEREMLRLASDEIKTVFKSKGWAFPRGEGKTFQAGNINLDGPGWVERWLRQSNDKLIGGKGEPNEPRIRKHAERNVANKVALAKRAANAEVSEDLGL